MQDMDSAYLSNKRAEGEYSSYFCGTLAEHLLKQSNGRIYLRSQYKNIWSIMVRKAWVGLRVCRTASFLGRSSREGKAFLLLPAPQLQTRDLFSPQLSQTQHLQASNFRLVKLQHLYPGLDCRSCPVPEHSHFLFSNIQFLSHKTFF